MIRTAGFANDQLNGANEDVRLRRRVFDALKQHRGGALTETNGIYCDLVSAGETCRASLVSSKPTMAMSRPTTSPPARSSQHCADRDNVVVADHRRGPIAQSEYRTHRTKAAVARRPAFEVECRVDLHSCPLYGVCQGVRQGGETFLRRFLGSISKSVSSSQPAHR